MLINASFGVEDEDYDYFQDFDNYYDGEYEDFAQDDAPGDESLEKKTTWCPWPPCYNEDPKSMHELSQTTTTTTTTRKTTIKTTSMGPKVLKTTV
jgi:hypothetical protein